MSSMPSYSTLKCALKLSLIASVLACSAAHAASPRLQAHEVSGTYETSDGSIVRLEAHGERVLVESPAAEYWTVVDTNLLVSPDGLRKIRLVRDFYGTVDYIEIETSKAR